MKNYQILNLVCDDVPDPAELPKDVSNVCVNFSARIGPKGGDAGDWFYFSVCTIKWITEHISRNSYLEGRNVIVEKYDWEVIESAIINICDKVDNEDWDFFVSELLKYADWEFDNYDTGK